MIGVRTAAVVVGAVNGIWSIVAGVYWGEIFVSSSLGGSGTMASTNLVLLALGVILVLDSAVGLLGWTAAFYTSAGISILVLAAELIFGAYLLGPAFIGGLVLALVTVSLDVVAANRKRYVSEENHPLNLPVFG